MSRRSNSDSLSRTSSVSSTPTESTPLISGKEEENTWKTEVYWLIYNAFPIVFTYLMQNSLQMASIFTLGHLVSV